LILYIIVSIIILNYLFNINIIIGLISRIRRLIILTKYTQENQKLLLEGIDKYKNEGILPSNFNKRVIPLGKL